MLPRKKQLKVKKNLHPFNPRRPLSEPKTAMQDEFRKGDIPGETRRSIMKLVYVALFLAAVWFLRECYLSWNIFSFGG